MNPAVDKIKAELKQAIKAHPSHNQGSVAAAIGIQAGYLSQILNDKRKGSFELLLKISDCVGYEIQKKKPKETQNQIHPLEKKLIDSIKLLKNKRLGLEIITKLQQIEQLDPGKLDWMNHLMDEWIMELRFREKLTNKNPTGTLGAQ